METLFTLVGQIVCLMSVVIVLSLLVTWATTVVSNAGKNAKYFIEFMHWRAKHKAKS